MANDDKFLLLEQYKLYCQLKEGFTERNFATNKFYLIVVIALFLIMFYTRDITFDFNISATLIMSIIGISISFFWVANADAYNIFVKVKLRHVIDEVEKQLPMPLHIMEMEGYKKYRKENKLLIFTGMQKCLAAVVMFIFIILFIVEFIYFITPFIFGPQV